MPAARPGRAWLEAAGIAEAGAGPAPAARPRGPGRPQRPPPRRRPGVVVAASLALGAASGALLWVLAGERHVLRVLTDARPLWLAACVPAELLAYGGYVLALRETARVGGGPRLDTRSAARAVAAGFGAFFAASGAGGFEVDYWALRRSGASRRDALRRVAGLGLLEYAVLAPVALGAALALILGVDRNRFLGETLPWLLVVPGIGAAVWLTSPHRISGVRPRGRGPLREPIRLVLDGIVLVRSAATSPSRHGLAFVGAAVYWLGDIACLWAALQAFHAEVAVPRLLVAYASGYVLTRRALPAGGIGIAELALTFSLVLLGVGLAPAALGVIAYRFVNFWLALGPAFAVRAWVARIGPERRGETRAPEPEEAPVRPSSR